MNQQEKANAGASFGATVRRRSEHFEQGKAAGRYRVVNYGGLHVSDPMHFEAIASCGPLMMTYDEPRKLHLLWKKEWDRLVALLHRPGFSHRLHALERLIVGGGALRWETEIQNKIVNIGLNHILEVVLASGTQDTTWFLGLLGTAPSPLATWTNTEVAAGDFIAYASGTLPAFTPGAVASQSVDNSASKASYAINANGSVIGGAYLNGNNAKDPPTGTLFSAGAFTGGDKNADNGDTLEVTATFSMASAT